jgi:hypothetical protein
MVSRKHEVMQPHKDLGRDQKDKKESLMREKQHR